VANEGVSLFGCGVGFSPKPLPEADRAHDEDCGDDDDDVRRTTGDEKCDVVKAPAGRGGVMARDAMAAMAATVVGARTMIEVKMMSDGCRVSVCFE